jgi:hypothetical protein
LAKNKEREQTNPERLCGDCPRREHDCAGKPEDACDFQTPNRADPKPKQSAHDLSTIEGINWQQIEKKQESIDEGETENKGKQIWISCSPMPVNGSEYDNHKEWKQRGVHERTGCETPKIRARPGRRFNESDPAQWPQNNAIGLTTGLPAGKSVAEFVQKHDAKKREILEQTPNGRVIPSPEAHNFQRSDNEPGKMQVNLYSRNPK